MLSGSLLRSSHDSTRSHRGACGRERSTSIGNRVSQVPGLTQPERSIAPAGVEPPRGQGVWVYTEPAKPAPVIAASTSAAVAPIPGVKATKTAAGNGGGFESSFVAEEDFENTLKLESAFLQKRIRKVEASVEARMHELSSRLRSDLATEVLQQVLAAEGSFMEKVQSLVDGRAAAGAQDAGRQQKELMDIIASENRQLRASFAEQRSAVAAECKRQFESQGCDAQKLIRDLKKQVEELRVAQQSDRHAFVSKQGSLFGQLEDVKTQMKSLYLGLDAAVRNRARLDEVQVEIDRLKEADLRPDVERLRREMETHSRQLGRIDKLQSAMDGLQAAGEADRQRLSQLDDLRYDLSLLRREVDMANTRLSRFSDARPVSDPDRQQCTSLRVDDLRMEVCSLRKELEAQAHMNIVGTVDSLRSELELLKKDARLERGQLQRLDHFAADVEAMRTELHLQTVAHSCIDELRRDLEGNYNLGQQTHGQLEAEVAELRSSLEGLRAKLLDDAKGRESNLSCLAAPELRADIHQASSLGPPSASGKSSLVSAVGSDEASSEVGAASAASVSTRRGGRQDAEVDLKSFARLQLDVTSLHVRQVAEKSRMEDLQNEVELLRQERSARLVKEKDQLCGLVSDASAVQSLDTSPTGRPVSYSPCQMDESPSLQACSLTPNDLPTLRSSLDSMQADVSRLAGLASATLSAAVDFERTGMVAGQEDEVSCAEASSIHCPSERTVGGAESSANMSAGSLDPPSSLGFASLESRVSAVERAVRCSQETAASASSPSSSNPNPGGIHVRVEACLPVDADSSARLAVGRAVGVAAAMLQQVKQEGSQAAAPQQRCQEFRGGDDGEAEANPEHSTALVPVVGPVPPRYQGVRQLEVAGPLRLLSTSTEMRTVGTSTAEPKVLRAINMAELDNTPLPTPREQAEEEETEHAVVMAARGVKPTESNERPGIAARAAILDTASPQRSRLQPPRRPLGSDAAAAGAAKVASCSSSHLNSLPASLSSAAGKSFQLRTAIVQSPGPGQLPDEVHEFLEGLEIVN
eukprot:TRINITY_DN37717_c0_g3_i1.p1 TRINITY_DN37717_c0_g3~~TRINITY_DN37717_c0_g3_i1.p1  ORF type:complete len:1039 (+),score=249.83 TRINITY_DN37717_c0_g3_i1:101-3217(+)